MTLPQDFINKYIELLQEEAPRFLDSFNEPPVSGFRSNPLKENQIAFDNPIPKTEWGYYGKIWKIS